MHRYQVLQSNAKRGEVVLSDDRGRQHLARPIRDLPEVGVALRGSRPALGLGVLMDANNQRAFKLIFEKLDCVAAADPTRP